MTSVEIYQQFIEGIRNTGWIEFIAVIMGIVSVWFSRKENIWVFPTGLINTSFYVYISAVGHLLGEAAVNFYYTVMNIYGWILWTKKNDKKEHIVKVTFSSRKEWMIEILFCLAFYIGIFLSLRYLKTAFFDGVIPWADAFASSTAFTGMWLMARKKVESWYFWILTNIASIPLYFVKGYVFTSVYYLILLGLAISGAIEWHKRGKAHLREQKAVVI